ncbi:MAG: response regulator transcription factor [Lachnospiraceae bacterium]|nr:response regulator transcription factor [Lachnospiraceae bacterium]
MEQIMIVEDDKELNHGLCMALKTDHRQIVSCQNIHSAKEQLLIGYPALVLLDVTLPDGSGLDLLRQIKKEHPLVPVILLTANDTDMDIVEGLEQGADDYITKPFSLSVLRARVNTQLRKKQCPTGENIFHTDRFTFDFSHMRFTVNGIDVELSKTEQKLLHLLIENRGNTLNRNYLIDHIWSDPSIYIDESTLSVTIKRLRDKLGAHDDIKTVYGIGYRWIV